MLAAIETSFDDTGLAICDTDGRTVVALLSGQVELHAPYSGVVPELAARAHVANLALLWRQLDPQLRMQLTALGVTAGPGLPGSLLAGINFARGLSVATNLPLYPLNHLEGHIFSPFMPTATGGAWETDPQALPYPQLALVISGGHTALYLVRSLTDIVTLGETLDDAVGELLDKVSALLGHGYPGGARLEAIATTSGLLDNEARYAGPPLLPVPMRGHDDLNFSYSGLKSAVVRRARAARPAAAAPPLTTHPASVSLPRAVEEPLLACLFSVILDSLWDKLKLALAQYPVACLTVSGGVAINGLLRTRLSAEAQRRGLPIYFPAREHCLDNAEMIAWLLHLQLRGGQRDGERSFDMRSAWRVGIQDGNG